MVEIEAYFRLMRVDESPDLRLRFVRLLLRMDETFLSYSSDRRAAEAEARRQQKPPPATRRGG